jgi:hypothetical protein
MFFSVLEKYVFSTTGQHVAVREEKKILARDANMELLLGNSSLS